jgi:methylglyoxal synthase
MNKFTLSQNSRPATVLLLAHDRQLTNLIQLVRDHTSILRRYHVVAPTETATALQTSPPVVSERLAVHACDVATLVQELQPVLPSETANGVAFKQDSWQRPSHRPLSNRPLSNREDDHELRDRANLDAPDWLDNLVAVIFLLDPRASTPSAPSITDLSRYCSWRNIPFACNAATAHPIITIR